MVPVAVGDGPGVAVSVGRGVFVIVGEGPGVAVSVGKGVSVTVAVGSKVGVTVSSQGEKYPPTLSLAINVRFPFRGMRKTASIQRISLLKQILLVVVRRPPCKLWVKILGSSHIITYASASMAFWI